MSVRAVYDVLYFLILCCIIIRQYKVSRLEKKEYRQLKLLDRYLGEVRHFYHAKGSIEEAVYDSIESGSQEYNEKTKGLGEIEEYIYPIYDILISGQEEELESYKEKAPNKYFTAFLALCFITVQYGDSYVDNTSLFLSNLNHLKTEIHMELLKREKIAHTFSGLVVTTLLPMFFLKGIAKWGINNLPELEQYYYGGYGMGITFLIFSFTLLSYLILARMKEEREYTELSHSILEKLTHEKHIEGILWAWGRTRTKKVYEIHKLLKRTGTHLSVHEYVFLSGGIFACFSLFFFVLLLGMGKFQWFYVPGCLFAGFIVSQVPRLVMEVNGFFMKMKMEDEVMEFHSILLMLMYIKRMDVETVLKWLESFSQIFRSSMIACVDEYSFDHEAALAKIKEEEPFPPFVRIIENLEVSDKVGIETAFDEISTQQKFYEEKRKQDNEIMISNKGVIAKVAAYIPLAFTLIFYLIVPFVLESASQLMEYMDQMNAIS